MAPTCPACSQGELELNKAGTRPALPPSLPRQILLLDEPTSALDSESEKAVQAALDRVMVRAQAGRVNITSGVPCGAGTEAGASAAACKSAICSVCWRTQPTRPLPSSPYPNHAHPQVGRTTLVVAHRLSTITACTSIAAVYRGRVLEQGSHAELLERNGYYTHLWEASKG